MWKKSLFDVIQLYIIYLYLIDEFIILYPLIIIWNKEQNEILR